MNRFFKDVGKSVQILGIACWIIGLIGTVVGSILICDSDDILGIVTLIAGIALMLSALPIYAFGQITRDVREIKEKMNGNLAVTFDDLPEL